MDAFGTVMTALHAAHKVYEVVKKLRDAPEEIQALQDQIKLLDNILPRIKDVLQRGGDSVSIDLLVTKAEELTSSVSKFHDKATAMFQDKRKMKRLKWLFKADEAKALAEKLKAFYGSLSAVCAAHSIEFPDLIRASLTELDQKLEESFASVHHRLQDGFTDVHVHLDSTLNATLVGVREVVQEELTMSMEIFMCILVTTLKREFRTMANEQRRGESHNFDQYSVLYDTSDVAQATNVQYTSPGQSSTSAQRDNLPSAMTPTAFHHLPPLVSLNEPPCKHCGCQCHRAASVWRTPKSLGSIVGNHYVKIPFPHRLWPGMVQCDVPTCKKGWLMEVRSSLPYWFARVEMQTRVEALPVHFCIQTPRVNPEINDKLSGTVLEGGADVFKELLYSRRATINDVDTKGRSLLHLAIAYINNARTYLQLNNVITAISYLLEVGVPREWQDDNGRSAAELALYWIQILVDDRASQLQLLEQLQVRVIGPLLQDDLNGVATRFGMTELHQRLFLPGPRLTAEGLVDLVPLRNTPDREGWTPLYYAIRWAPYAVEMLLNAGAGLVHQPLRVAMTFSDSTAIGLLIRAGADVNERDDPGGCTPLIYLTKWTLFNQRCEKMNELMRHAGDKIDWDARDDNGKTALDYALEERGSMKFVRLLKRYSSRDILEQGRGSAIQVGNWGWTYGDDGYAYLYHGYSWSVCECPLCVVEGTRIREVTTEEEEEASMPGGFKL
ncbi:hypothetical protein PHLCEN_2v853 [Hermanssonia centrifuga]|uniref:Uncharacterized protein n=1 Tax=Hermanssonia centrifuga TaxID=98765 RepID=A0A2R6S4Y1_9APHY|nr:hypothetical protein PHLCEN_2v853 [Hermanssonia centrifuga]